MKTTPFAIRINDYQREKLEKIAKENNVIPAELVRILIDKLIEGRIVIKNTQLFGVDVRGLQRIADSKGVSLQTLIDAITEQLDESCRDQRKGN